MHALSFSSFRARLHAFMLAFFVLALSALFAGDVRAQGYNLNGQLPAGTAVYPSLSSSLDSVHGLYFGTNRTGVSGHFEGGLGSGSLPVLSACGTTPTLATGSTDTAGTVTMGTSATGCVITFGTAYTAAPTCTVTWQATPLASQSYTVTTTAITTVQTSTSNNILNYTCVAKSGG